MRRITIGPVRGKPMLSLVVAAFLAVAEPMPAFAEEAHGFDIAAADASQAVREFGKQAGVQILVSAALLKEKKLNPVSGRLSTEGALRMLLADTGLTHRYVGERGVVLLSLDEDKKSGKAGTRPVASRSDADMPLRVAQAASAASSSVESQGLPPAPEGGVSRADAEDESKLQEVIVTGTGSRVTTGANAPIPTTTLTEEDLLRTAPQTIANLINAMPAARSSVTTRSTANESSGSGGNFLDLHGLGVTRSLVLVDGRRFVWSNVRGGVDIDVVPQALINGIDIVTGGVSAVYGSDAVSGVVNLRLNDKLEGGRAVIQSGVSQYNDEKNYLASLAYGSAFAGGRGHAVAALELANNEGVGLDELYERDWAAPNWGMIANPAATSTNGEPLQLLVREANPSNRARGGLINSGPLKGIQFGPGGVPIPFQYGENVTASTMQGGAPDSRFYTQAEAPSRRRTVYTKLSYDMTDDLTAYTELSYGQNLQDFTDFDNQTYTPQDTALLIRADNAFLPESIRAAMQTQGISSFTMGRTNFDYAITHTSLEREARRGVLGLEGRLGGGWAWDAYYIHGRTKVNFTGEGLRNTGNFNLALDSVIDPATGTAVCRSTLTNPDNGCVPINLFGVGSVSDAADRYVSGTGYLISTITQDVAAFTVRGEPFSTWAGGVRIATGAEYRREEALVETDEVASAMQTGGLGWLPWGNLQPWSGDVSVKEAFAEALVPLARDRAWARTLDVNLAGRITNYSTSGTVKTWKLGTVYQPVKSVRFRGAVSRDIRAPSLFDLFSTGTSSGSSVFDPFTGTSPSAVVVVRGNPNLNPEKADTWTVGMVLSPTFAPGLNVSMDYYHIKINDAINTLQADQILLDCFNGQAVLCDLITRDAAGTPSIAVSPVNLDWIKTSGTDFELRYRKSGILGGEVSFRGLASYTEELLTRLRGVTKEYAGSTVQASILGIGGQPHWKGNVSITYARGPVSVSAIERYVGGGVIDTTFTTKNLADISVPGRSYTDLSFSYDAINAGKTNVQVFAVVNNLMDRAPPIVITGGFPTARALYDAIGRTYSAGLRINF